MDFLKPGQRWPPETENARLALYAQNRLLFEGKHERVFSDWIKLLRDDQQATLELILNWNKRLSLLWADLLLGEPPQIKCGDPDSSEQEAVERIVTDNELINTCYEVVIDISRHGTGLFKVRLDGRGIIEGQPPAMWFPVVRPDNVKQVMAHVLAWTYKEKTRDMLGGNREHEYLRCEIHEPGKITYRTYECSNSRIGRLIDESEQLTGIQEMLVIPINNVITTDRVYGIDDYSDLDSIIQELEMRLSQISRILDKHADPNMYGPDTALVVDPVTGEASFQANGKYFSIAPEEKPPGYLVWEGQLEAAFRQVDALMSQLYILSDTSPACFGELKVGLAESGSALKRLMMAPLAKVNRIRMRLDPALKKAIRLASELEAAQGMAGAVKLDRVHITWKDGLPEDPMENTTIESTRYAAGLSSLESSLRRLDGLEGEALQQEVNRIKAAEPPLVRDPATRSGGDE